MTRTNILSVLILLGASSLSAHAQEEEERVEGRAASQLHARYAKELSSDLDMGAPTVRQIRVLRPYRPRIGLPPRDVASTGAEVQFHDAQGNAVLKIERLQFNTAEEAAHFTNAVVGTGRNGDWAIDLRGEWVVRVTGTALSDPKTLSAALNAAWQRGPASPERQARVIRVRNKGYVFEDRVGLEVLERRIQGYVSQARYRAHRNRSLDIESLSDSGYSLLGTSRPASLTFGENRRSGWIGLHSRAPGAHVTTEELMSSLDLMARTHLPEAKRKGMSALVGSALNGE